MSAELGVERAQLLGSAPPMDVAQQDLRGEPGWRHGAGVGVAWSHRAMARSVPGSRTQSGCGVVPVPSGGGSRGTEAIAGTAERSGWPSSSPAASPGAHCSPPAPRFYPVLNEAGGSTET